MNEQAKSAISYEIIENSSEREQIKIEKHGMPVKFTLGEIKKHQDYLTVEKGKLSALVIAHEGQVVLLENRHPEWKDIPNDQWEILMAYCSKKIALKQDKETIETIEKQEAEYEAEVEIVNKFLDEQPRAIDLKDLE